MIGSCRSDPTRSRLAQQPTPTTPTSVRVPRASLALGGPRIFTAIDGMRAPFYSHVVQNCQSLGQLQWTIIIEFKLRLTLIANLALFILSLLSAGPHFCI
jgi:hypothetical protein